MRGVTHTSKFSSSCVCRSGTAVRIPMTMCVGCVNLHRSSGLVLTPGQGSRRWQRRFAAEARVRYASDRRWLQWHHHNSMRERHAASPAKASRLKNGGMLCKAQTTHCQLRRLFGCVSLHLHSLPVGTHSAHWRHGSRLLAASLQRF